jgi:glycerol-3-phosphate acyltransferase PlsY
MPIVISALLGYLIGGINPAYLIAKYKGFDIRKRGSGNAGASNAVITMGKKVGAISAILDIFKAYLAVTIAGVLFPNVSLAKVVMGISCILGHIFPIYMRFRGGKGLASLGGVILAFHPIVFVILLSVELIIVLIVDYICIVPITASVAFPFIYMSMTKDSIGAILYGLLAIVIFSKHIENLKRIRSGTEAHFSFLWRRKKEIERLGGNPDDITQ